MKRDIPRSIDSRHILSDILNYLIKLEDAPASAQTHMDHVIFMLSRKYDIDSFDDDEKEILKSAREHMSYYYNV